jgi:hypothetical protein
MAAGGAGLKLRRHGDTQTRRFRVGRRHRIPALHQRRLDDSAPLNASKAVSFHYERILQMNVHAHNRAFTFLRLLTLSSVVALLAGCPPGPNGTATVQFEQLGACNGYRDGNNVISAGPNAAYVLFKITTIDNKNGKVDFAYDPAKIYLSSSSPRSYASGNLGLMQKIGRLGTTATNVPVGTTLAHNGYAVIVVQTATSPDPQLEANASNYVLSYESSTGGPGVLMSKKNSTQTQYQGAQDCLSKAW